MPQYCIHVHINNFLTSLNGKEAEIMVNYSMNTAILDICRFVPTKNIEWIKIHIFFLNNIIDWVYITTKIDFYRAFEEKKF